MKRMENESFEDYKERRKQDNVKTKRRLEGIRVWPGDWGTYKQSLHGAIETRLKQLMDRAKNKKNA